MPVLPAVLRPGAPMASLSRALRVAAARPRQSPTRGLGPCNLSSASGPTAEKSVPYQRTLKEGQGTSVVAQGPSRPLPSTANVVVIGGGSLGCQTLYHLAKLGMSGAVLLERERLTSGTTWHTAGLLWQLRPSDVEVELLAHTRRVVSRELEEETGLHTGWIQNGGLFIASNRQRLDEYKRLMSLGKAYGVESHVLSPAETKTLYPLMNVDDLYGTLYVPHDGTMDPAGTCSTLARAASARGAQVIENCPVTGIRVWTDDFGVRRVAGVETQHGSIQTPCVVNCAGVWASAVGRMAGVKVPLVAMHHAYVVTERIEGIQNMPNVRDHDASVYLRLQGDALSVGGYEANPIFWEEVSDKFAFGLFDLDWEVFTQHIEGAINRVPVLEKTGIKSTVCGPESFTPDHKPLMGEAPEVRGFFLGCGFNSAGMMLGGGCGQELAHWIIHGRPEKDMHGYDIRRFHHSLTDHPRWIRERSHESYAKNYSVVFPHDEPLAGRNMRRDPLHEELLGQGCVFQERHGWERPGWFHPQGPAPVLEYDYYGAYGSRAHEDYAYRRLLADEYTFDFPPHHDTEASAEQSQDKVTGGSWASGPVWAPPRDKQREPEPRGLWPGVCLLFLLLQSGQARLVTWDSWQPVAPAWGPGSHVQGVEIKKECLACRGAAAVFDMSYFGKFYLVGLDARKAADWLFSADVSRPPGSTVYTCMLNCRGGTESDLTVSRLAPSHQASPLAPAFEGDGYYLAVGGAMAQHNWSHITTVLQDQKFRCRLIDNSEDLGMVSIQGPASRAILQEVLDADLSNKAFPFSTHKLLRAAGHLVRAIRLSFVGELGWELHIPKASCVPVYRAVMAAGAKHGLVNAGYRAIDSLSTEKGYRHWHADLRPDDSPLEAGLAFTCKLKSPVPFLGREALEQQRAAGLRRRLVCFTVEDKVPMFGLEAIWRNGQVVGHVRRADFGFAIDKTIAYGYIHDPSGGPVSRDFVKSGDYALERMGVTYGAQAHLKSPFDPDNKRVKGTY
ncbi:sarcosine dehydrogenase, mitochondrial isoform X3 [Rhinopithecus roxellana]|uniref:sarcosine dehydrogenase, mitochondrial isoform X3 n=1 Tax=Rhinopithecus roxellana TaxID=61622 RepID=UPI0005335100|nr:sarcosine dehydrogenase, mitochondrial isoform X3 [Rhinopithecus roxellana]